MFKTGLVLEGGGMRGIYTAGVIDALIENDIECSSIYGVSSSACHAMSFVSKQKGRAFRVTTSYLKNPDFCGIGCLLKTGCFFGWEMMHKINTELDPLDFEAYEKYQGTFYAVTTSLRTGLAAYLPVSADDLRRGLEKIQASCAIPLLSTSISVEGRRYLDGCISNPIPLRKSIRDGNEKHIVVLDRDRKYIRMPHTIFQELFYYLRYIFSPGFGVMCLTRFIRYNQTLRFIRDEEKAGRVFVLAPKKRLTVSAVSRNYKKLKKVYEEGYEETTARMDELKKYLGMEKKEEE